MGLESYPIGTTNNSSDEKTDYSCTPTIDLLERLKNNPNDLEVKEELNKRLGTTSNSDPQKSSSNYDSESHLNDTNNTDKSHPVELSDRTPNMIWKEVDVEELKKETPVKYVPQRSGAISKPNEALVTYGLGPCVALVLYDEESKTGMLAHADGLTSIFDDEHSLREIVYRYLNNKKPEKLKSYIIGGNTNMSENIIHNISMLLQLNGIKITGQDILGDDSKSVILDTRTGVIGKVREKDMKSGDFPTLTINELKTKSFEII